MEVYTDSAALPVIGTCPLCMGVGNQQAMGETGKRDSKVRDEGPKQQAFSQWHQLG